MMPPSRQDDGGIRAPARACVVCVVVHVVALARVRWWLFYRQLCLSTHTPPRRTPVLMMSGELADSTLLLLLGSHSSGIQFLTAFCPAMAF